MELYDVVVCREGLAEEVLAAALLGKRAWLLPKVNRLPEELFGTVCGQRVLVCGSYYDPADVARLTGIASSAHVFVYDPKERSKYHGAKFVDSIFPDEALARWPWAVHILRRTRGPQAGEIPDDEAFYRGALLRARQNQLDLDMLFAWLGVQEPSAQENWVGECTAQGHLVLQVLEQQAQEIVQLSSNLLEVHGYSARMVVGAAMPVMPLVIEAARDVDLGINWRYNLKTNSTHLTFYTHSPDRVDLSFVERAPFNGGGRRECKGVTVCGRLVPLSLDLTNFAG
jgi:hypothetical protein